MVDLDFVMDTYKAMGADGKPLLIMYGQMAGQPSKYSNVTCTEVIKFLLLILLKLSTYSV